jgi:outer membrane protein TolC
MKESLSFTSLYNLRASEQNARSAESSVQDSRDLVLLAVTGAYLQISTTAARAATTKAQVDSATAVYDQAVDRNKSGLAAHIDVNRALVELQTQQARYLALSAEFEKEKLMLARLIGLPMAQPFVLSDVIPRHEIAEANVDELIRQSWARRADVQAASLQVKASEAARKAAIAEYLPSLGISGDYGVIGITPTNEAHGTFTAAAAVQFPIFRSGRIRADIDQASAALNQRKAESEDIKAKAEQDVRVGILDLATASQQLKVAESNRTLAQDTLQQARDRFHAGISDTVELVQAEESLAAAEQDYISALYALNIAQVSLARAVGDTEQGITRLLRGN